MMKKALGKGLEALITYEKSEEGLNNTVQELKINDIEPNRSQPRKFFDDEKLRELSDSIKEYGIIQPIIVKKDGASYKIIAGERRWRAARLAGVLTVPVIIKDVTDKQVMEMALIENLQREDLNPIEEAEAYAKLIQEYGLTQEAISQVVGKSRPVIANSLRLLNLDDRVKKMVASDELSSGHARALAAIEDKERQYDLAQMILKKELTVRDTEKLVKSDEKKKNVKEREPVRDPNIINIEDNLKAIFGTKVQISHKHKKGKILIEYYSNDELERLLELFEKIR